jgi:hypothetical protein
MVLTPDQQRLAHLADTLAGLLEAAFRAIPREVAQDSRTGGNLYMVEELNTDGGLESMMEGPSAAGFKVYTGWMTAGEHWYDVRITERDIPGTPHVPPYSCGHCECRLPAPAAHAACGHGYMTGCDDCGNPDRGGYSAAQDPESAPPCQLYIAELEEGIAAGNTDYQEEYTAIRNRWPLARVYTRPSA